MYNAGEQERFRMKAKFIFLSILITQIILVACGGNASPTPAPEALYTEVAATVMAQSTLTALAMPSATQTQSFTGTPTATNTVIPLPTIQTTQAATLTQSTFPTAYSPATSSSPQTGDHASFGSQSPSDGTVYAPQEAFQMHWFLRNTGTTTWTKQYYLKFIGGVQLWSVTKIFLTKDIVPGKGADFYLEAIAPVNKGDYINRWALYNSNGDFIFEVYLHFFVK